MLLNRNPSLLSRSEIQHIAHRTLFAHVSDLIEDLILEYEGTRLTAVKIVSGDTALLGHNGRAVLTV